MLKELEISNFISDSEYKTFNIKSEYDQLCDNVTDSNLEHINSLLTKIESLYYKSYSSFKTCINGLEDLHIDLNRGIFLLRTEKFEENGVIIKKITVPTTHKNNSQESSSESDEFTESSSNSIEESDLEDEVLSQHKLEAFEQQFLSSSTSLKLFRK